MQAMADSRIWPEHEWTLAWDDLNFVFAAKLDSIFADRSLSSRAIHPNPAYSGLGTIFDYRVRSLGSGHEEGRIHWGLDVLHTRETTLPE